ncbi:MAG: NAD(P)-dependent oxidoreductase [Planctomycetaceae bacterium]|jgi:nucleoside-diphosphate-sugar epimerase|nr:NAD(P)-dependent oxidoreductase [Planctomycetaceae bacterium]
MRSLITGASGFIGYHLVRRLRLDVGEIRCLARVGSDISFINFPDVEIAYGDLSDVSSLEKAVKGCDVVYHLAGRVRAVNRRDFMLANCGGTQNLLTAISKLESPPVLVYVSSVAAAGPSGCDFVKVESDISAPVTDYGFSKLAAECCVAQFCERAPCSIVRPGIVFGGADKMSLALFRTVQRLGICPVPGWRVLRYSWIHGADLSELLLSVANCGERVDANVVDKNMPSGVGLYYAASNDGEKLSDVGKMIGKSFGRNGAWTVHCPPLTILAISTFYEIKKLLTKKNVPYDWAKAIESKNNWRCSPKKSQLQLNFKINKTMEERIQETTNWYKENKWL